MRFEKDKVTLKEIKFSIDHSHEYDDKYNVDGVNMLERGTDTITDPPNVLTADGIFAKHTALKEAALLPGLMYNLDTTVTLQIINPYSVDTATWAAARASAGLDDGIPAIPATMYYQCTEGNVLDASPGTYYEVSAPDFNELSEETRTCDVQNILVLTIRFNDINALRASRPNCIKDNTIGPILPPTALIDAGAPQNTSYRDGAIVVRALADVDSLGLSDELILELEALEQEEELGIFDGETLVVWENANYEHLGRGLDKDLIPEGISERVECAVINEHLREYKDPAEFGGSTDTGTVSSGTDPEDPDVILSAAEEAAAVALETASEGDSGIVSFNPTTGRGTGKQDVEDIEHIDGRMSWREILSD